MNEQRRKIFGKNIKNQRINKGITQTELANNIGISEASVSLIERGGQNPSVFTVYDIAKALGVEIGEFFKNID